MQSDHHRVLFHGERVVGITDGQLRDNLAGLGLDQQQIERLLGGAH